MILIGYRLVFECACSLLNVHIDPDIDYVENDYARELLELSLLASLNGTKLTVIELSNGIYYLGLKTDICKKALPDVMTSYEMSDRIAMLSIEFHRELKKVGIFKYMNGANTYLQEPSAIQFQSM